MSEPEPEPEGAAPATGLAGSAVTGNRAAILEELIALGAPIPD
jgi:hypothetical protein